MQTHCYSQQACAPMFLCLALTASELYASLGKPIDSHLFKMSCLTCLIFSCVYCFSLKRWNYIKLFVLHELVVLLPKFFSHRLTSQTSQKRNRSIVILRGTRRDFRKVIRSGMLLCRVPTRNSAPISSSTPNRNSTRVGAVWLKHIQSLAR